MLPHFWELFSPPLLTSSFRRLQQEMAKNFLMLTFIENWQRTDKHSRNPCAGFRHFKVTNGPGGGKFVRKQEQISYNSLRKWASYAEHDAGLDDLAPNGNEKVTTSSLLTIPHQVVYWVSLLSEYSSADPGDLLQASTLCFPWGIA